MQPEAKKLLADMREAAEAIGEFVAGKTVDDFGADRLLRSGVYYQFIIIGEALARIRDDHPDVIGRISEHWRIIAFRNQIIHGYARIDDEITCRIVESKLPILRNELVGMLAEP